MFLCEDNKQNLRRVAFQLLYIYRHVTSLTRTQTTLVNTFSLMSIYNLINHFLSTDLEDDNTVDGLVFLTCQQDPL